MYFKIIIDVHNLNNMNNPDQNKNIKHKSLKIVPT